MGGVSLRSRPVAVARPCLLLRGRSRPCRRGHHAGCSQFERGHRNSVTGWAVVTRHGSGRPRSSRSFGSTYGKLVTTTKQRIRCNKTEAHCCACPPRRGRLGLPAQTGQALALPVELHLVVGI